MNRNTKTEIINTLKKVGVYVEAILDETREGYTIRYDNLFEGEDERITETLNENGFTLKGRDGYLLITK